jgi:hypothetical protein
MKEAVMGTVQSCSSKGQVPGTVIAMVVKVGTTSDIMSYFINDRNGSG